MKNTEFLKKQLIANRGLYDNKYIYENTIESFKLALLKEYTIALSVQHTKDGILVVYHDHDLTKVMNLKDRIDETNYEELEYLCSYHIPTLEEVLEVIGGRVPIIINPRNQNRKFYLEKELVKIMDNYQGSFAITSASASIIKWFNVNRPSYIIGEIITKKKKLSNLTLSNVFANYSIITDFKSVNLDDYDVRKIRNFKEQAMILGYVVDTNEKYQTFKDVCDNLFIDNVNELNL